MREDSFKFGMPLLCAEWPSAKYFLVGGGGGTAATGIKNRILIAKYEVGAMSDQLVDISLGTQYPVRSALHPELKDVLVALGDCGIKHFKLKLNNDVDPFMKEIEDSPVLDAFDGIKEEVCCLLFNTSGNLLFAGFTGGWIQVWAWPEMHPRIKLREEAMFTTLKDLDVSHGEQPNYLVLTTTRGTSELWDFLEGKIIQELPPHSQRGGRFVHCRFLPESEQFIFYSTSTTRSGSSLFKWKIFGNDVLKLMKKVKVTSEVITAISLTSELIAVGTNEGHIKILTTNRMLPMQVVREAHMIFVTNLKFCKVKEPNGIPLENFRVPDGMFVVPLKLLSVSGDASARVTEIKGKAENTLWLHRVFPYLLINLMFFLLALYLLLKCESILEAWDKEQPQISITTNPEL